MAQNNETMVPIPTENLNIENPNKILSDRLDKLEKDNAILKETISKQKRVEAEARLNKDTAPRAKVRLWEGIPIIARKTIRTEHVLNPATGLPTAQGITEIDLKLADGTEVKKATLEKINAISNFTWLKQKELRQVRDYELWGGDRDFNGQVWVAEWEDPLLQVAYGDVEINVRYLNT